MSVVNMVEENTKVAEASSDDEFSSVGIPYPLRLPRSTIVFANLRIKYKEISLSCKVRELTL